MLSYLRVYMGQGRLYDFALMRAESEEIGEKTDFDYIKEQFASVKSTKIQL